jgi:hypothetical protein
MLLPRRSYGKAWQRILHDQTADRIVDIVSQLPHVNATIIPFHVVPGLKETSADVQALLMLDAPGKDPAAHAADSEPLAGTFRAGTERISHLQWRTRAAVVGRVKSIRVQSRDDVPTLECVLVDGSGEAIALVFLGRRSIAGLKSGTQLVAQGMIGKHKGRLAMINPEYELLSVSGSSSGPA